MLTNFSKFNLAAAYAENDGDVATNKILFSKSGIFEEDEKILLPMSYIMQTNGSSCIDNGIFAMNYWFNVPDDKLKIISEVCTIVFNASCLLDDIYQGVNVRNGRPSAHKVYGVALTINAANYAYIIAIEKSIELDKLEALEHIKNLFLLGFRGCGLEMYYKENFKCPTEDEYKKMIIQKTGAGFLYVANMLQMLSEKKEIDLKKLMELYALYFQIHNDYTNLKKEKDMKTNTLCNDITEGKFGFPLVHAIHNNPENDIILNILKKHTTDNDIKKYFISLLEDMGSFEYTQNVLKQIHKEIDKELEIVGSNPYFELIEQFFL